MCLFFLMATRFLVRVDGLAHHGVRAALDEPDGLVVLVQLEDLVIDAELALLFRHLHRRRQRLGGGRLAALAAVAAVAAVARRVVAQRVEQVVCLCLRLRLSGSLVAVVQLTVGRGHGGRRLRHRAVLGVHVRGVVVVGAARGYNAKAFSRML